MKFLVDVHLPIGLSKFLSKHPDCEARHLNQILQKWHTTDTEICSYADYNDMAVITKDEDFKNSHFIKKTPRKVIRILLGNISNADLILLFDKYLPDILGLSENTSFYIELDYRQLTLID